MLQVLRYDLSHNNLLACIFRPDDDGRFGFITSGGEREHYGRAALKRWETKVMDGQTDSITAAANSRGVVP
jgi:hypothetical protein